MGGILAVAGAEFAKVRAQFTARAVLAVCGAGPFAFVAALRAQHALPEDTLFGRSVTESGFATPLVVLGFAALWVFPALTSVVGGDLFSAEDRYGTWATVLTRSRSRAEVFAGKVLIALGFSTLAVCTLAVSSLVAGLVVIGHQPLIDLSGTLLPPTAALARVAVAWASVLPPAFGFCALSVLLSVVTRSSAAGVGLPVVAGLAMQLCATIDGPEAIRRLLLTSAFGAWHGLLVAHPFYRPLAYGTVVSAAYVAVALVAAYRVLRWRDLGG
jgi:ABC-2 type transport system permease protein